MKLNELADKLKLDIRTAADHLEVDVTRGYASDLMSDVMANATEGDLWITLQIHQNIVAVSVMKSLSGIILVNSREPEEETLRKAEVEKVPIMISSLPAFELAGRMYELGLRGT